MLVAPCRHPVRGSVGSERFQAEIEQKDELRVKQSGKREDAAFRRPSPRAEVGRVQAPVAEILGQEVRAFERQRKGGWERALLAKPLVEQAGMTQREAAGVMGLKTGGAVSIQLRRLQEGLAKGRDIEKASSRNRSSCQNLLFLSKG